MRDTKKLETTPICKSIQKILYTEIFSLSLSLSLSLSRKN